MFILAYLMFDEVISIISYFGGVLIITGVIIGTNDHNIKTTPKQLLFKNLPKILIIHVYNHPRNKTDYSSSIIINSKKYILLSIFYRFSFLSVCASVLYLSSR